MKTMSSNSYSSVSAVVNWLFGLVFLAIGVLNLFLVHFVPGIFYILLAFVYLPPANTIVKERFGFSIPFVAKIVLGLLILWGTLAVGDLVDMFD